jgi:hypothetical protein
VKSLNCHFLHRVIIRLNYSGAVHWDDGLTRDLLAVFARAVAKTVGNIEKPNSMPERRLAASAADDAASAVSHPGSIRAIDRDRLLQAD